MYYCKDCLFFAPFFFGWKCGNLKFLPLLKVSQLCRKCLKRPESNITVRRLLSSKQASPVVKLGDEVYYGTFEKTLKYVKLFSLINSAVVLSAVPFLMTQNWEKLRKYRATSAFAITSAVAVGMFNI